MAELLDQLEVTAAIVSAEAQWTGHIDHVLYYYEGLADWVVLDPASPPAVAQGTELHLAVYWVNDGNTSITGHVGLTVTRPDEMEETLEAVQNQGRSAPPGAGWGVEFTALTLDQLGSYQARATLTTEV